MASNPNSNSEYFDAVKFAGVVSSTMGKSSLTRDARNSIAMYPMYMSADIKTDDALPFATVVQMQYAALLVSVISARSDYDIGKYPNPVDYLRTFFNNSNLPPVVTRTLSRGAVESEIPEEFKDCVNVEVAAHIAPQSMSKLVGPDVVMECYIGTDAYFNMNRLNHAYLPATDTQEVMESLREELTSINRPAMEANGGNSASSGHGRDTLTFALTRGEGDQGDLNPEGAGNGKWDLIRDPKDKTKIIGSSRVSTTGKQQAVLNNPRMNGLEPTLINLQLIGHKGDGIVITHNVVIGVKVCVTTIPSEYMVSNLVQGVLGSRFIFNYIKSTKGQYSWIKDFVFGVSNARESAVKNKDMRHWISSLKRTKDANAVSRFLSGDSIPPMATVVLTAHEAALIEGETGVNLNEPFNAMKLLSKYYMLAIAIVDTATGEIKILFDGDDSYSHTTMTAVRGKSKKDTDDLTQIVSILRAAGGLK